MSDAAPKLNLLVSYPYLAGTNSNNLIRKVAARVDAVRLLVDSGAFTAWNAGHPVHLGSYCRLLERLPIIPWRYFALDVIGDHKATRTNYISMLRSGFTPVPVFQRGAPLDDLEFYYEQSDLVAIGGLVGQRDSAQFVNGIMARIGDRRVHWLGFTNMEYVRHYRPYSIDSSSWESGARYGSLALYAPTGAADGQKAGLIRRAHASRPDVLMHHIRALGRDPSLLRFEKAWHGGYSLARQLCALSAVDQMTKVQHWCGTLMFAALTTDHAVELLLRAWDHFSRHKEAA